MIATLRCLTIHNSDSTTLCAHEHILHRINRAVKMDALIVKQIDQHLTSPSYAVKIMQTYRSTIVHECEKGKRVIVCNFHQPAALLAWLETDALCEVGVSFVTRDRVKKMWSNLGSHEAMLDTVENTPGSCAIMIATDNLICSVTALGYK